MFYAGVMRLSYIYQLPISSDVTDNVLLYVYQRRPKEDIFVEIGAESLGAGFGYKVRFIMTIFVTCT